MSPSPKDMPSRLPLHVIFREPPVVEPLPEWANDLRWKRDKIWGEIKTSKMGRKGTHLFMMVRFDGELYTARHFVPPGYEDDIPRELDVMVDGLDDLLDEHGHPFYEIRSTE